MAAGADRYSSLFAQNEHVSEMIRSGILIFMISFSRGLVVLLACIFTLPVLFGMTGVWMAAPVTEGVTLMITAGLLYREYIQEA